MLRSLARKPHNHRGLGSGSPRLRLGTPPCSFTLVGAFLETKYEQIHERRAVVLLKGQEKEWFFEFHRLCESTFSSEIYDVSSRIIIDANFSPLTF